jgi:hypothetical protein
MGRPRAKVSNVAFFATVMGSKLQGSGDGNLGKRPSLNTSATGEARMPIRCFASLAAGTLTIVATATAFLALAHDGSHPVPKIYVTPAVDVGGEGPFLIENDAAMKKMMNDMAISPTGDVDVDFVAMMVPHHQGAIDMAIAVLRHGRNPRIRRLAQEIIVTQQQEIAAMRLAVGQPLPPSLPAPTQPSPGTPGANAHD